MYGGRIFHCALSRLSENHSFKCLRLTKQTYNVCVVVITALQSQSEVTMQIIFATNKQKIWQILENETREHLYTNTVVSTCKYSGLIQEIVIIFNKNVFR